MTSSTYKAMDLSSDNACVCFLVGDGLDGFQVHLDLGRKPSDLGGNLGPIPKPGTIVLRACA